MNDSLLDRLCSLATVGILTVFALLFYFFGLNHVSINEVGVAYDSTTGTITKQPPGWHVTHPLVFATSISLLPFRVEMFPGQNLRVLNVKLVRFVPEHLDDFIAINGFGYLGNTSQAGVFAPYAFSGKTYSFLEVIQ